MVNNRVFWAVKALGIAPQSTESYTAVHGLQSVGITTTFNLEEIFEIGQIAIYENIEDIPDVEVTLERVIDGYPLAYHLATSTASTGTLAGRSAARCNVAMSIFGDTQDSASGTPVSQVYMSGMFASALTYTFPSEGSCTESVTLLGNHKEWKTSSFTFSGSIFDNTDTPLSLDSGTGGVQRRENVVFAGDSVDDITLLPGGTNGIPGISSSGTNDKTADVYGAHVQSVSVSSDLGRTNLVELGRRLPYFRYVEFPTEVTCDIEVLSIDGDRIEATEDGVLGDGNNLNAHTIRVVLEEGLKVYLGTQNKLSNVTYGGGDTGGGNDTTTYSYSNFNILTVTHPQDPAGF